MVFVFVEGGGAVGLGGQGVREYWVFGFCGRGLVEAGGWVGGGGGIVGWWGRGVPVFDYPEGGVED